ncbi:MAG: biotin/lipoyl-binding protein [Pseudomonadota bacterium]|nr:biotin/lipoyl-binding protein [Pseudomonadota bacterium]
MKRNGIRQLVINTGIVVIVLGLGYMLFTRQPLPVVVNPTIQAKRAETMPLVAGDYVPQAALYGRVDVHTPSNIHTKIQGEVKNIYIKQGDRVKHGQVLLVLDDDELQRRALHIQAEKKAKQEDINTIKVRHEHELERLKKLKDQEAIQLEAIESAIRVEHIQHQSLIKDIEHNTQILTLEEKQLKRMENLVTKQAVSDVEYEKVKQSVFNQKSRIESLQAQLEGHDDRLTKLNQDKKQVSMNTELAINQLKQSIQTYPHQLAILEQALVTLDLNRQDVEEDIKDTRLTSTVTGKVAEVMVTQGSFVRPHDVMAAILPEQAYEIKAQIPSSYYQEIEEGLKQGVITAELMDTDLTQTMTLARLLPQSADSMRQAVFVFDQTVESSTLFSGLPVLLRVNLPKQNNIYRIPMTALYPGNRVFVVDDQKAEAVTIQKIGYQWDSQNQTWLLVKPMNETSIIEGKHLITQYMPDMIPGMPIEVIS